MPPLFCQAERAELPQVVPAALATHCQWLLLRLSATSCTFPCLLPPHSPSHGCPFLFTSFFSFRSPRPAVSPAADKTKRKRRNRGHHHDRAKREPSSTLSKASRPPRPPPPAHTARSEHVSIHWKEPAIKTTTAPVRTRPTTHRKEKETKTTIASRTTEKTANDGVFHRIVVDDLSRPCLESEPPASDSESVSSLGHLGAATA